VSLPNGKFSERDNIINNLNGRPGDQKMWLKSAYVSVCVCMSVCVRVWECESVWVWVWEWG
jgi:hypothetical protein